MEDVIRIEVKLYGYHDLDLVSIYQTGQVYFPSVTKQILNSYARKEVYRLRLPPQIGKHEDGYYSTNRRVYHYHVDLEPDQDMDAIRLIEKITPGYRNNFIKSVFRQYLCGAFSPDYSINGDTTMFEEMARKFQCCRKEEDPVFDRKRAERGKRKKDARIPKIGEEEKKQEIALKKEKEPEKEIQKGMKEKEIQRAQEDSEENTVKTTVTKKSASVQPEPEPEETKTEKTPEDPSAAEENQDGESDFFDFLSMATEQY